MTPPLPASEAPSKALLASQFSAIPVPWFPGSSNVTWANLGLKEKAINTGCDLFVYMFIRFF